MEKDGIRSRESAVVPVDQQRFGVPWPLVRAAIRLLVMIGACAGVGAGSLNGQILTVDCEGGECYVVPLARGSGGFVGRARSRAGGVTAVLVCQGIGTTKVVTRELVPDRGGVVSALFGVDDGRNDALFCESGQDAAIEIVGLTEGGWYWLSDESGTAVAPMLSRDVLDNRKVRPVNPGSRDILIEANRADTASFVKQFSTGRVGILHHVPPEPEFKLEPCGPVKDGELEDGSPRYFSRETGCAMGDGGTFVGLHVYVPAAAAIRGGRVLRPESGVSRVRVSLWLNRTGSVVHGDPEEFPPTFGWPGVEGSKPLLAEWEATLLNAGPNVSLENAGVDLTEFLQPDDDGYVHLLVRSSESYCPMEGERHSARVRVRATGTTTAFGRPVNPVRPRIRRLNDLDGAAAEATFDIVCPETGSMAAPARVEGQELVDASGAGPRW